MTDRFDDMMSELMIDLYEVQSDADAVKAITEKPEVTPETVEEAAPAEYTLQVKSKSTGQIKQYSASHVSSSKSRNFELLGAATLAYTTTTDDAKRAAIRVMIDALLNAL
jgi:hypothetical protein